MLSREQSKTNALLSACPSKRSMMNWRKAWKFVLLILVITILAVAISFAIVSIDVVVENDFIELRPDLWPTWNGYNHGG